MTRIEIFGFVCLCVAINILAVDHYITRKHVVRLEQTTDSIQRQIDWMVE